MIRVLKPGLLTTVQDSGRWGYQSSGVPVAGPMDPASHRLANVLVGNQDDAATLEVTLTGPELEFQTGAWVAVTGATFRLLLDEAPMPAHAAWYVRAGSRLRFGERSRGARAYLAIAGGIDVPPVLGSRATHVTSRMGGFEGRPLVTGDHLRVGLAAAAPFTPRVIREAERAAIVEIPIGGADLRVMLGPQHQGFSDTALELLRSAVYTVSPQSDRMGYRLDGPPLERAGGAEMISEATPLGAVQVPAGGRPILLMADRQTTGGYRMIATVITADLPKAGQLAPGDWIRFAVVSRADAITALIAQERATLRLKMDAAG